MGALSWGVAPQLMALAVVLYILLYELFPIRGVERRARPWSLGFDTLAAVFILGRILQRTAVDGELALLGVRVQIAAPFLLCVVALGFTHSLLETKMPKRFVGLVGVAAGTLTVLALATELGVAGPPIRHVDALGSSYWEGSPGPLALVVLLWVSGAAAWAIWLLRRAALPSSTLLTAAVLMFGVLATNDMLNFARVIHSVQLAEIGFAVVAVGATYAELGRMAREYVDLEADVERHTGELLRHQEQLERALSHLQASERRFRQLSEATLEGVVVHEDGRILDANATLARMVGRDVEELMGQEVESLFVEPDRDAARAAIDGHGDGAAELRLARSDGQTSQVEVLGVESHSTTERGGVVAVRDITEREHMRKRLQLADRLASVGTLAAGTAHEINNPLAYVTTNLTLIEEELDALSHNLPKERLSELGELIHDAQQGCERVRRIVRDLKALSRSEPDEQLRPVDVVRAIDSSLKIAGNEIRHRARLVRELQPVPAVLADPGRLGQVFLNLLVNAAQSIPEGRVDDHQIGVRLAPEADRVVIEVSDTGAGMSPETRSRIFDPFYTTKQAGQGTGLGLSICHGIVTALGGRIEVRSELGRGSTFRVELPVAPEMARKATPSTPPTTSDRPTGGSRVLVVDDEPAVARALERALRDHDVRVVHSGREALACCENERFDLILCDLMMPDLTGMDVHAHLLRVDPDLAARTVFVTGGAFTPAASEFLATIPNIRLQKPVDVAELRMVVARAVERGRQDRDRS